MIQNLLVENLIDYLIKKLSEIALNHEQAGKGNDYSFVEANYDEFIQEINRIVKVSKEYIIQ